MLRWLTTVLARLTRRDPSGPPPRVGWNGRPLLDTAEGMRNPDQRAPPTAFGTLKCFVPPDELRNGNTPGIPCCGGRNPQTIWALRWRDGAEPAVAAVGAGMTVFEELKSLRRAPLLNFVVRRTPNTFVRKSLTPIDSKENLT